MDKDKIAIIGGAGFLASRLSERFLESKKFFKRFDIKTEEQTVSYLNIEDPSSLEKIKGSDVIINLAAMHRDDVYPVSRYDDINVKGSANVCNAARKFGINKIIFTSSVAIYGFAPPDTDESGEPNYFNDYGRTKYLAEQVYKEWLAEDPINRTLIIVRPTVIFGEGNRGNVYNLLKQISLGRFVMFGNGKNEKSMAYVENVAAFLEYCLSFKPGLHVHNYIDKPDLNMNDLVLETKKFLFGKNNIGIRLPSFLGILIGYLADTITKISGKNLPISGIRVKKFMGTTKFSSSVDETGFIPPVKLKEGLRKTLRYEFIDDNSRKKIFKTE